ncbi:MAG TPA: dihydrofolate reductase [Allocoleopsis sp.]
MIISLLVAVAENDVIGKQGELLPWKLSSDLKRFKELTMGHPIIMGRKTYETIGRPLPGRLNIIITRDTNFTAQGCTIVHSIPQALNLAKAEDTNEIFIIGGGVIFEETLPLADKLYLTEVHAQPDGDTFFRYNKDEWQELERQDFDADDKNQYPYSFVTLVKKEAAV